jgi:hypothetical protein
MNTVVTLQALQRTTYEMNSRLKHAFRLIWSLLVNMGKVSTLFCNGDSSFNSRLSLASVRDSKAADEVVLQPLVSSTVV